MWRITKRTIVLLVALTLCACAPQYTPEEVRYLKFHKETFGAILGAQRVVQFDDINAQNRSQWTALYAKHRAEAAERLEKRDVLVSRFASYGNVPDPYRRMHEYRVEYNQSAGNALKGYYARVAAIMTRRMMGSADREPIEQEIRRVTVECDKQLAAIWYTTASRTNPESVEIARTAIIRRGPRILMKLRDPNVQWLRNANGTSIIGTSVSYQPAALVPVKVKVQTTGKVTVSISESVVTPIGVFSLGADGPTTQSTLLRVHHGAAATTYRLNKGSPIVVEGMGDRVTVLYQEDGTIDVTVR